jgi:hypothetical protein
VTADGVFRYEVTGGGRAAAPTGESAASMPIEADTPYADTVFGGAIPPLASPTTEQPLQA